MTFRDSASTEYSKICKSCGRRKPLEQYWKNAMCTGGRVPMCSECCNGKRKTGEWKPATPYDATVRGKTYLKWRYDLTPEQVEQMAAYQADCCAICGIKPKRLVIDHCHSSGKVRALLCHGCNLALGQIEKKDDWLEKAMAYIASHKLVEVQ